MLEVFNTNFTTIVSSCSSVSCSESYRVDNSKHRLSHDEVHYVIFLVMIID